MELANRQCIPCTVGTPPLTAEQRDSCLAKLGDGWRVVNGHHLEKEIACANFGEGLTLVNRVGVMNAPSHGAKVVARRARSGNFSLCVWALAKLCSLK